MLINWIHHTKSESELFLYTRDLLNERLKPVFEYKIAFGINILVLWIHKGYFVVKNLMWNVRIKAFWYTKMFTLCVTSNTKLLKQYNSKCNIQTKLKKLQNKIMLKKYFHASSCWINLSNININRFIKFYIFFYWVRVLAVV